MCPVCCLEISNLSKFNFRTRYERIERLKQESLKKRQDEYNFTQKQKAKEYALALVQHTKKDDFLKDFNLPSSDDDDDKIGAPKVLQKNVAQTNPFGDESDDDIDFSAMNIPRK